MKGDNVNWSRLLSEQCKIRILTRKIGIGSTWLIRLSVKCSEIKSIGRCKSLLLLRLPSKPSKLQLYDQFYLGNQRCSKFCIQILEQISWIWWFTGEDNSQWKKDIWTSRRDWEANKGIEIVRGWKGNNSKYENSHCWCLKYLI